MRSSFECMIQNFTVVDEVVVELWSVLLGPTPWLVSLLRLPDLFNDRPCVSLNVHVASRLDPQAFYSAA
jgi:hypothetical protein